MLNPREGGKRVAVCSAVALHLGLPLDAFKQVGKTLEVIKTFVVLADFCYNKGVVFVTVQEFVFGKILNLLPPNYVSVENGAIDAFAAVLLVN